MNLQRTICSLMEFLKLLWIGLVQLKGIMILWPSRWFILILSYKPMIVELHHEPTLLRSNLNHLKRSSILVECFRDLILWHVSRNIFLVGELWFLVALLIWSRLEFCCTLQLRGQNQHLNEEELVLLLMEPMGLHFLKLNLKGMKLLLFNLVSFLWVQVPNI